MKNLFLIVSVSLFCGTTHAQTAALNGVWSLSGFRCENGSAADPTLVKGIMESTRKSEISFNSGATFTAEIAQGTCTIVSSGSYSADSASIQMSILDVKATNCPANKGSYSVQYAIQDGELLMYQPIGYYGGKLCGSGVRGIQVLTKK